MTFAGAACSSLPEIGGMPLSKLTEQERSMYRNLADIPDAPPVTAPDVNDSAIDLLSQQRAAAERAADQLHGEAFTMPAPAPAIMPF